MSCRSTEPLTFLVEHDEYAERSDTVETRTADLDSVQPNERTSLPSSVVNIRVTQRSELTPDALYHPSTDPRMKVTTVPPMKPGTSVQNARSPRSYIRRPICLA
jgi:hypothetical protein